MDNFNFTFYTDFPTHVKKYGIESAAKYATDHGYSSVEFLDMAGTDGYVPTVKSIAEAIEVKKVLDRYGLKVACFSVGAVLIERGAPARLKASAVDELKYYARLAKTLGSPFLHHTLVLDLTLPENAASYDDVFNVVLGAADEIANFCESLGLTCLYEPQGMYFNGLEGYGRIYRELKRRHKNVGFCADVGNSLFADEMPYEIFKEFAADALHVHLKNYIPNTDANAGEVCNLRSRGGTYLDTTPLESGSINIPACLKILKEAGYRGAFALEDSYSDTETSSAMELVKNNF